ncbi:hypothetical protein BDQ12DRAFT_681650 [Crucibulum laeve]|uniref:Uncharacterized protein n=1 Tax=Crucibulum laeve TaxID=68775 RepID=A0A5C3M3E3_9AGAR|nr:hypothetical protein BDQ12DRAFT_681650 [Crucibulum laeve]
MFVRVKRLMCGCSQLRSGTVSLLCIMAATSISAHTSGSSLPAKSLRTSRMWFRCRICWLGDCSPDQRRNGYYSL